MDHHSKIDLGPFFKDKDIEGLQYALTSIPPADAAELIGKLDKEQIAIVFSILPITFAEQVFEFISHPVQVSIMRELDGKLAARLLNNMPPDDRTAFLKNLSADSVKNLLLLLSDKERAVTLSLLGYPPESVGRLMSPDYIIVQEEWTIEEALKHIRQFKIASDTLDAVYIIDQNGILKDDLRIAELLLASPEKKISDLMDNNFISLKVNQDQEVAVKIFSKYHRAALPVTDDLNFLVGIVTIDDILHVSKQEDTEDIQKIGGMEVLDAPYLEVSILKMVQKRAGWLVILFLSEMLTATAMGFFEDEIAKAVILALFVPLIISSGGNSGSQATTLIIRAMALGEVRIKDWWKIMRRELASGLLLGVILGTLGFFRIFAWTFFTNIYGAHWNLIALTVGFSLVGIVLWGSLTGSMLPLILKKLKFDPAASSAPFVATLVDVTGLVIYFTVAMVFLKGTLL
jgi:magnesium transporter